ncbi:MAG TPA: bifunctional DNA-formamidopyrimidine glycosylase/DNA-(apurinic or apyrimidinic site) lyase [Acidimicrobiia bacterium]|nr:bifunctional DNA-formamidopyrimidine glycosylase/DNA-(apurinic or apyrimidinic site) lyase [Acidimicrobiia bacterium]
MPELPEVEVVRRGLAREVAGREVTAVTVTGARTVRRQPAGELAGRLTGARLGEAGRIGKFLLVPLDDGTDVLVIHLRMSGQLLLTAPDQPLARHTHAVLALSDGRQLRFVDPRTFGELFVAPATGAGPGRPAALGHLGPDPLSPGWSAAVLGRGLAGRTARLKALLMDQRFVAGIGNIYSDEALFEAGLRFDRPAGSLSAGQVGRLHRAVRTTLAEAVRHRGSSLRDAQYVDLFGRPGGYQNRHRVYGREGEPCPRCGGPVRRLSLGGRSTFFCETCQPA